MIKFRCQNCGQKIGVNDEGAGVEISCPTCAEKLIVPAQTAPEFQPGPVEAPAVPLTLDDATGGDTGPARAELLPHLARLMTDQLVQRLLAQRAELLAAQQAAAREMEEIEARLVKIQEQFAGRAQDYEQQIAGLQQQLAAQEQETERLAREKQIASRRAPAATEHASRRRVDLSHAGFLLRA